MSFPSPRNAEYRSRRSASFWGAREGRLPQRLAACDTVIFLDYPRLVCIWRVLKRGISYFGRSRPDMAPGCPEQLPDLEFLRWIWNYPKRRRDSILGQVGALGERVRVVVLRDDEAVTNLGASLTPPS